MAINKWEKRFKKIRGFGNYAYSCLLLRFYDFDSLKHILESSGFAGVKKCGRLEGAVTELELIELPDRELETLYVEAVKL